MAKPFDATSKHLVEAHPADWLALAGLPANAPAHVIESDVSSITAAADKVIRVDAPCPYLAHLEFQSARDDDLDLRVFGYNAMLRVRHRIPVWSAVFLLHPRAAGSAVTGRLRDSLRRPAGTGAKRGSTSGLLEFRYSVVRVWECPANSILAGGLGTLALAPISEVRGHEVAAVVQRVRQRFEEEAKPAEANELTVAMAILMGLRYEPEQIGQLLKECAVWKTQACIRRLSRRVIQRGKEQGRVEEARSNLLRVGRKFLGAPTFAGRVARRGHRRLAAAGGVDRPRARRRRFQLG